MWDSLQVLRNQFTMTNFITAINVHSDVLFTMVLLGELSALWIQQYIGCPHMCDIRWEAATNDTNVVEPSHQPIVIGATVMVCTIEK